MPRAGGESDKLGNRYEGLWTVQNLLDLLSGDAIAIQPESFEESRGVEFIKTLRNNSQEFHSVKRQRTGHGWRLSDLTRNEEDGRSVLGDLFDKVNANPSRTVVFVSATVHSQAYEVWDRCTRSQSVDEFERQLKTDKGLYDDFSRFVLPLGGSDMLQAFCLFRSFRLVPLGEDELRRQLQRMVRLLLYRPEGSGIDPLDVILKLADFVLSSLGRRLTESDIRSELERHGYHLRDWARDQNVAQRVNQLNAGYLHRIQSDLILGGGIVRVEATSVAEALQAPGGKLAHLLVGAAGRGKSCAIAQILETVRQAGLPFLVIRLDNVPPAFTSQVLGRELGLPDSPALVLAGLAQGKRAILVVDQLDAVSVVSGRNEHLWQVFQELLEEVRHHPNIRLLLACREFDLENDPRLAKLVHEEGPAHRVDLDLLPIEIVKDVVSKGGGDPARLSTSELELLRLPFHLHLFLQGEPANPIAFGGRQELFTRFWKAKRIKTNAANADFDEVVGILSDQLSANESISIPADRLDAVASDAEVLVSENVLVLENGRYRFFHEAFFDYAFARRFVRECHDLVRFLTQECSEQHLFRRAQVRQILAYQRENDRASYMETLRCFLAEPRIRLHLKKLTLDWLAQLDDPTEEEWNIVFPLLKNPQLHWAAFNLLWGKVPWFDLLQKVGVFPTLLTDSDPEFVDRCVRALSQKEFLEQRSVEIAKLLQPFRGSGEAWDRRLREVLQLGNFYHSGEMFSFVLDLQQDGLLDNESDDLRWHSLTQMAEHRPEYAVEFLGRALERLISRARADGGVDPFSRQSGKRSVDPHFIQKTAESAPIAFAMRIAPMVKDLVLSNAREAKCGGYYDEIWQCISSRSEHETSESLLGCLQRSLQEFARTKPGECSSLLAEWNDLDHKTLRFLLLSTWQGNPAFFASQAADYFVRKPLAFMVRFDISVGSPLEGIALPLLKAISPLIEPHEHAKLESAIHGYRSPYEKDHPEFSGHRELMLFFQLSPERLSQTTRLRFEELQGKFPERKASGSGGDDGPLTKGVEFVPPPVSTATIQKLTGEQFIEMCQTSNSNDSSSKDRRAHRLWGPIRNAAKTDRSRFASFVLSMPDDIHPIYFDAVLTGLVDESRELVKGPDGQTDVEIPNDPLLETNLLMEVITRVHQLPGKPCGKAICRVADGLAKKPLPIELVEIVAYYALHDPDPECEEWEQKSRGGKEFYGGDPLSAGINSSRGSAADSFGRFLFAHPEMAERLIPYVEALALDKSVAVRAVNIEALRALLNTNKDKAVELFIKTMVSDEALWATHSVEDFIFYATFTHFSALRPLLQQMLKSTEKKARHTAARQITLASLRHAEALDDMSQVLAGDEECRRGAAEIYALNVHHGSVREACIQGLKQRFHDPEKSVRERAASWFHDRSGTWADWQRDLLCSFLKSEALVEGGLECMMSLEETPGALPSEFLYLASRATDLFEASANTQPPYAFSFAYKLPALVIRFYEQTSARAEKTKCLDLLDRMLALGWGEAATELSRTDR